MNFTEIPNHRPHTPLLDSVNFPADVRQLPASQLEKLCSELREFLLYSVNQSGGHFAAGLGVVELTAALHYVYNTPEDRLVWDVGHQAYPHKILTGRREQMPSIRSQGGLTAFNTRSESEYDTFGVGHSSTSISAALGMALALQAQGDKRQIVAIIGDGALTAGQAFEALNQAGREKANLLVVLNDNDMSISNNVSAINKYLTRIWSSQTYASLRTGSKRILENVPSAWEFAKRTEEHMKGFVAPGAIFEELGFNYFGPIDGHDLDELVLTLNNLKQLEGPRLLHVVTRKGKGFIPAEDDPIKYHALKGSQASSSTASGPTYSNIFGQWVCQMAAQDERLMAITPAMKEGSDLIQFAKDYPRRYFDVAIAEQHAVTLAAGMACENYKPVVAIYSTFLQRAYDQLIHDVALQNLDVLFAIDRAGLVGEDGPTHHGVYDLSYLRCIPNMVVMTPADENECWHMLYTGYQHVGPVAVRYPRGRGPGALPDTTEMVALPIGKGVVRRLSKASKQRVALLAFGAPLQQALEVAEQLDATVADMRFVKPLDVELVQRLAAEHDLLVTLEDNAIQGGAGSAVLEALACSTAACPVLTLGVPDRYIDHASQAQQYQDCGFDAAGIVAQIQQFFAG